MDTSRAFKLATKIKNKTEMAVCIDQKVWVFDTNHHSNKYTLTYFISHSQCLTETFDKWFELENWCKEKWNV